jgi:hypothetical protein
MNRPERNGPARGCRLSPSHDHEAVSSQDRAERYSEAEDFTTPADFAELTKEQRRALHSVAFWLRETKLPFRRRWVAQPGERPRTLVCFGNFPGDPTYDCKLWLWHPSGYIQDLGEPKMFNGADVAENVAKLIPGSEVLDCRHDYGRVAA